MTSHCRPDPVQKMLNMEMEVLRKMRSPVVSTFVNTENISFERSEFTPPPRVGVVSHVISLQAKEWYLGVSIRQD